MKFRIHRASRTLSDASPCDGAFKEGDDWFLEIPDLNALVDFCKREGSIVFDPGAIWIYDAYME